MGRTDEQDDTAYLLLAMHDVSEVASTKESKNMPSRYGSLSSKSYDTRLSSRTQQPTHSGSGRRCSSW